MPGLLQETTFRTIEVTELHPTFGAEIRGVDFVNLSDEQLAETKAAMAKVRGCEACLSYPSLPDSLAELESLTSIPFV